MLVKLAITTSCLGIFVSILLSNVLGAQIALAQGNSTSIKVPTSNATGLPESGLQLMLLTKKRWKCSVNQIFTYNIVTNELTSSDLRTNSVEKKVLNRSETENLIDRFYNTEIFRGNVFDRGVCPDCIQYGLSYFFVDLETLIPFKAGAFWTENTTGAEGFMEFAELIESMSPK